MRKVPARIARYLGTGRYRILAIRRYQTPAFCEGPSTLLVVQVVHTGGELVEGHEEVWFTLTSEDELAWAAAELGERPELEGVAEALPEGRGICGEEEEEPP